MIGAQENKQMMSRRGRLGMILIIVTVIRGEATPWRMEGDCDRQAPPAS
jgi:hypothetical protein